MDCWPPVKIAAAARGGHSCGKDKPIFGVSAKLLWRDDDFAAHPALPRRWQAKVVTQNAKKFRLRHYFVETMIDQSVIPPASLHGLRDPTGPASSGAGFFDPLG